MKTFLTIITALSLLAVSATAQTTKKAEPKKDNPQKIGAVDTSKHYDETMIVTGKVAQVTIREKQVYLNLDQRFPDSPFTGVIFAKSTNQFGDLKKLENCQVEISGKIAKFHEKPEIILDSTNQLTVTACAVEPKKSDKKSDKK